MYDNIGCILQKDAVMLPDKHVWMWVASDREVYPDVVTFIEDVSVSWTRDLRQNCNTTNEENNVQ